MSQRQLKLVLGNSNAITRRSRLDSVKCKPLRAIYFKSPLVEKVLRLENEHPEAARMIDQLIDDVLSERTFPLPPLGVTP